MNLIAETAWHHDGDFTFMKNLVQKIVHETKADTIKLHISLDIDEYMSSDHPGYNFMKERIFTENQWEEIINEINGSDKELMLLFNDKKAVDFGMQFSPSLVEIHSVCLNDIHLLRKLKEYENKSILTVLGVGGSTLYEIENAIIELNTENIVLMHGFQNYPTKYRDINFKRIRKIINLYPTLKHGYADHTAWDEPNNILITSMGAAMGMSYVEKHVTIVPGSKRTDWQAALSIENFNIIAQNIKILNDCEGSGSLRLNEGEIRYSIFGPNKKAAFLKKSLKKGEKLVIDNIEFKRTATISDSTQLEVLGLVGKMAKSDIINGAIISKEKFE